MVRPAHAYIYSPGGAYPEWNYQVYNPFSAAAIDFWLEYLIVQLRTASLKYL